MQRKKESLVFMMMVLSIGCEEEMNTESEDSGLIEEVAGGEASADVVVHDLAVDDSQEIPESATRLEPIYIHEDELPTEMLTAIREDLALTPRYVIGDNDRYEISDTTVWPYSSVVKLYIYWYEDDHFHDICTGSLILENVVLTAAHCVFDSQRAYKIKAVPGEYTDKNGRVVSPFGIGSGKKLYYPKEYPKYKDDWYHRIPYDYAVIRLKSPFENAKTRAYGVHLDPLYQWAKVAAYHGDIASAGKMVMSEDKVRRVFDNGTFNHYIDTEVGSSGGGITGTGEWENKIFATVSTDIRLGSGNKYNIGTLLTEEAVASIDEWTQTIREE